MSLGCWLAAQLRAFNEGPIKRESELDVQGDSNKNQGNTPQGFLIKSSTPGNQYLTQQRDIFLSASSSMNGGSISTWHLDGTKAQLVENAPKACRALFDKLHAYHPTLGHAQLFNLIQDCAP